MWILLVLLGFVLVVGVFIAWRDRRRRPGPHRRSHIDEGEAWVNHHLSDMSRWGGGGM